MNIEKYGTWVWVCCIVILIIMFSVFLFCLKSSYDPGGRDYLLSAVSQVLGATFALVFTITFVIAELSAKYSSRMLEGFFTKWVVAYMFLFIVSIVFPLLVLMHISDLAVKVSLILCAACLLLLIPYFVSIRENISPKNFLENLLAKAVINLHKTHKMPEETKIIDNVVMSSYSFKDYDTFEIGLEKLGQLAIAEEEDKLVLHFDPDPLRRIKNIGLATIEDSRALILVVKLLTNVGYEAIDKECLMSLLETINSLGLIGCNTANKQRNYETYQIVNSVYSLGMNATRELMDSVICAANILTKIAIYAVANEMKVFEERMGEKIAVKIWYLGASFVKHIPEYIGNMSQEILDFESLVGENYVEEGLKEAERFIDNDLKPHLEKIKKYYKEKKTMETDGAKAKLIRL